MISRPTAIILGAGASMPYGFPSGRFLVEQICAVTIPNTVIPGYPNHHNPKYDSSVSIGLVGARNIIMNKFGESKTEDFGNALYFSQKLSIDSFLEHRPEFIDIGKFAIALFVLEREIEANLFNFEARGKGCYQYLFDKLNTSWQDFASNKTVFITFNYDRSLEHFLFTSLKHSYGRSDDECAEQLRNMPIIHVHGSLGKLPWQSKEGIQYGADFWKFPEEDPNHALAMLNASSTQIKVITEDQTTSEDFQMAYSLMSEAERIYFLGFGYDPTSMERLGIQNIKPRSLAYENQRLIHSPLMGTGFCMENAEIFSAQEKWHVALPDNSSDSLLFLRKYAELD